MTFCLRRREFIAGLGGAAVWPVAARAQQPRIPVIGFLHSGTEVAQRGSVDAFLQGLEDVGFVEGRNVAIVFRWANIQFARIRALAADLVRREVAVLVAAGGTVLSAKAATDTIPIVAIGSIDLVKWGVVASLSRPGGNVTGITFLSNQLMGKRLDLLRKMLPEATTIGFLTTTGDTTSSEEQMSYLLEAARSLGCEIIVVKCRNERDFENAFATFKDSKAGALIVGDSGLFGK
jgi:putative ABC transport system substrate-binding protein